MSGVVGLVVGLVTGILSGLGLGGGTLLLLYLTQIAQISQQVAQGINLLYFIPTALCALPGHIKRGYVIKAVTLPALVAGLVTAACASYVATALPTEQLRPLFGVFLLVLGLRELVRKP